MPLLVITNGCKVNWCSTLAVGKLQTVFLGEESIRKAVPWEKSKTNIIKT